MPGAKKDLVDGQTREWLTEGEVRNIATEVVTSQIHDALEFQNGMLGDFKKLLDKIADGAQSQILSATILHGSPTLGLKGVLPELQERVGVIETDMLEMRRVSEERFGLTSTQLQRLESNQGRIWRSMRRLCTSSDGQVDYRRMIALATGVGALVHMLLSHWPGWRAVWDVVQRTADKL